MPKPNTPREPRSNIEKMKLEAAAAAALISNYRAALEDDAEAKVDLIEGETGLLEALSDAVARDAEISALIEGLKEHKRAVDARIQRLSNQSEMIRAAIAVAMSQAELPRVETPVGTVTVKALPPKIVATDEALIPSKYWVAQDPKLDKRTLLADLKEGAAIPGVELSNGGETIQIRRS